VIQAKKKPFFIDKPAAAKFADTTLIYQEQKRWSFRFSRASSLRYMSNAQAVPV